jgi:hypothetical protein
VRRSKLEVWTLDSETDPFLKGRIPRPFIWGAYNLKADRYEQFKDGDSVADFFAGRSGCRVYAHNGGKFDYHYLRDHFNSDEPILVISGRIARFRIGDCEFRDSFNILPVPLRAYSKDVVDYRIFEASERDKPENRVIIEKYLRADCVYLAEFIDRYFTEYGSGLTQAGASLNYWAKNYRGGQKPKQSAVSFETYKPYYFGGRVECFQRGYKRENFSVVDINSAYPYSMLSEHPIAVNGFTLSKLPAGEDEIKKCFITLDGSSRGALPWRDPESGELFFPHDDGKSRTYHCTGHEFLAATELDLLRVDRIRVAYYFDETCDFKKYIHHFYDKRKAAKAIEDKAGDIFAKLFMNSLYGKFASDPSTYDEYMIASEAKLHEHITNGWNIYKSWDSRFLVTRSLPVEKQRYYNVATAASITGFVRAHLQRSLASAGGLIYCDTDSIAARDVSKLKIGPELGQWKLEMDCDEYAVAGKKLYAFRSAKTGDYKIACKGVKLTAKEIIRVAKGEKIKYHPDVPTYSITRNEPRFTPREVQLTGVA